MKQRNIGLSLLLLVTMIAFFTFINRIGTDYTWRVYASGAGFFILLGLTMVVFWNALLKRPNT